MQKLFADVKGKKSPRTLLWKGEDLYLEKELKEIVKTEMGAEIKSFAVGKNGLSPESIEASQGGLLFSPLVLLVLEFSGSVSAWKKEAQQNLEEVLERADGQQLIVWLKVPTDKRFKWDGLKCESVVMAEEMPETERLFWIRRMNTHAGEKLDAARLQFIAQLEGDLMQLEKYIELWNLGGDLWARQNIAWESTASAGAKVVGGAFDWVDFVFQKNPRSAMLLVQELMNQGEDPIKLLALISKSARILALIEMGKDLEGVPPFLSQKLKRFKGQSARLLSLCKEADALLKSTSTNSRALMQRLSS